MQPGQNYKAVLALTPQAVTNGATVSCNIDTIGLGKDSNAKAEFADIDIMLGTQVNTNAVAPTVSILECDTTVVTSFVTIQANVSPTMTAGGSVRAIVPLAGRKRYLRVTVGVPTATNDNQVVAVMARLKPDQEPNSTTDLASTNSTAYVIS